MDNLYHFALDKIKPSDIGVLDPITNDNNALNVFMDVVLGSCM